MIKPGEEWGTPTTAAPDVSLRGTDADLAALTKADGPAPLVCWSPVGSEFARSVGVHPDQSTVRLGPDGVELPVDACWVELHDGAGSGPVTPVVNAAVLGIRPTKLRPHHRPRPVRVVVDGRVLFDGRATSVVIANGQYLDGWDLVPRGHPGDGRLEVQVYALRAAERGPMRRRLPSGTHLPHPRIVTGSGRMIEVDAGERAWPTVLDGRPGRPAHRLVARVRPRALRLLI